MAEFFDFSGFSAAKNMWLVFGFSLAAVSFIFYYLKKDRLALLLLTLGGLCLYIFGALTDPFLHFWDERFHALVAKNCMETPMMPRLYPELPMREFDPNVWPHAYIWLHKQPLFTWQIALCFKLFGVSEFTLRLPSVIMSTLMIPLCYRIGKLFVDRRLGFYTALSAAFSWFLLDLVSGHGVSDHNNVCFVFYVTASVWSWMEYVRSGRKWGWAVATGVLSGCAILTKWLTGLLVYLVWGVYLLAKYRFHLKEWKILQFVAALAVTVTVALPWQIFTMKAYPKVARVEMHNNAIHFSTVIEKEHGQEGNFYLETLPFIYIGDKDYDEISSKVIDYTPLRIFHILILLAGFGLLVWRAGKWEKRIPLLVTVLFVYLFFSIAAMKLPAYPFCICAAGFMSLGMVCCCLEEFIQKFLKNRGVAFAVWFPMMALVALYQFNFTWYKQHHTSRYVWWRSAMIENVRDYKNLQKILPEKTILFNVRAIEDWGVYCTTTEAMFYSGAVCYSYTPDQEQLQMLKSQGYHIAVLTHLPVPDYMMEDDEVMKIDGVKILYDL
ncbi:MAG: glycosyltransferase family 39 protein [Bacteroidales bacterium]|nr:glycosyltransferase family 39 protein [Bacteroidales bacterium]